MRVRIIRDPTGVIDRYRVYAWTPHNEHLVVTTPWGFWARFRAHQLERQEITTVYESPK